MSYSASAWCMHVTAVKCRRAHENSMSSWPDVCESAQKRQSDHQRNNHAETVLKHNRQIRDSEKKKTREYIGEAATRMEQYVRSRGLSDHAFVSTRKDPKRRQNA